MKKILVLLCTTFTINAHDFLTEIIIESESLVADGTAFTSVHSITLSENSIKKYFELAHKHEIYRQFVSSEISSMSMQPNQNQPAQVNTIPSYLQPLIPNDCSSELTAFRWGVCGGEFDNKALIDDFLIARVAAGEYCNIYQSFHPGAVPVGKTLLPEFVGPTTFTSSIVSETGIISGDTYDIESTIAPLGHHINYNLSQGLSFNCAYQTNTTPSSF